jgi:hypothetical protein
MIYTAPYIMFLMLEDTLRGQVGGGWALEIETFLGPVKWHRTVRRVPFGAQKSRSAVRKHYRSAPPTLQRRKVFLPHCSHHPPPLPRAVNFNHKTY